MSKILRGLSVVLLVALMAAAAYAQHGPRGRWWRDAKVVEALHLTDGEIQRLESAFDQSKVKMIELKSRVEAEQFQLQTLLEKNKLDEAAVKAQNRKLEQARTQLANERTAFVLKVRKIIGPQRFQKLAEMR
jgi:Spy/CpxP family protein refolding chaperone